MNTRREAKEFSRLAVGIAALALLLAGCAKPVAPVDAKAAEQAVKTADTLWSKAASAHDFTNLFKYYADDATVLPANEEMLTNKPGVQKYWGDHLTRNVDVSWTPMYVEAAKSGDLVYDLGSYTMTTNPAKGKGAAVKDHGKYLAVWKKQPDGSWKAEADTWNSDLPAKTRQ
jgi:ketosteroid isomerase-like protein